MRSGHGKGKVKGVFKPGNVKLGINQNNPKVGMWKPIIVSEYSSV